MIDDIAPMYIGAERFKLALAEPDQVNVAHHVVRITVDYSEADDADQDVTGTGVCLPLVLIITGPSRTSTHHFRHILPSQLFIRPPESGRHVAVLREFAHNQFFGKLVFEVSGTAGVKLPAAEPIEV